MGIQGKAPDLGWQVRATTVVWANKIPSAKLPELSFCLVDSTSPLPLHSTLAHVSRFRAGPRDGFWKA